MRTTLLIEKIRQNESIINLDNTEGPNIRALGSICEKRELRTMYYVLWQFWQSSTAERILTVSNKQSSTITRLINHITTRTIADSFVYSFYETSNLRIDIALFNSVLVWNMSLTFTLTVRVASSPSYFLAIDLGNGDYELGLTDFETYYTLANINSTKNKFYYATRKLPKDRTAWNFTHVLTLRQGEYRYI